MLSNMSHMRHDLEYGANNRNRPSHGASISHRPKYRDSQRFYGKQNTLPNNLYAGAHRGDSHIKLVPARQRNAKHTHRGLKPVTMPGINYQEFNPMAVRYGINQNVKGFQKRGSGRSRWIPKIMERFQ